MTVWRNWVLRPTTFRFSNFAATKTIVKRAKQPTPKEKLAKLLREHQAHCQGILLGTTPLRKRTDIKRKRAAKRPRPVDNDDSNALTVVRPPRAGDVHTVLPATDQANVIQQAPHLEQQDVFQQSEQMDHPTVFQNEPEGNTPQCSNPPQNTGQIGDDSLSTADLEQINAFHPFVARSTPEIPNQHRESSVTAQGGRNATQYAQ